MDRTGWRRERDKTGEPDHGCRQHSRNGEALVLATKAGLDPEVVFNAVKGGLAGSAVLNAKAPMVISRNFKPGFRIRLHQKDLRNALLAAEEMKVSLPFTSLGATGAYGFNERRLRRFGSLRHCDIHRGYGKGESSESMIPQNLCRDHDRKTDPDADSNPDRLRRRNGKSMSSGTYLNWIIENTKTSWWHDSADSVGTPAGP